METICPNPNNNLNYNLTFTLTLISTVFHVLLSGYILAQLQEQCLNQKQHLAGTLRYGYFPMRHRETNNL